MSLLAKKKSNFQGQKQWSQKFHIKFRNTGTPHPLFRKYSYKNIFYAFPLELIELIRSVLGFEIRKS